MFIIARIVNSPPKESFGPDDAALVRPLSRPAGKEGYKNPKLNIRLPKSSKQPFIRKAIEAAVADDKVVEDFNFEHCACFGQFFGEMDIVVAWF
jgi:hypothetical protein